MDGVRLLVNMEVVLEAGEGRNGPAFVARVADPLVWVMVLDPEGPVGSLAMGTAVHLRYSDAFGSWGADARVLPDEEDAPQGRVALRVEGPFHRVQRRSYQRVSARRTVRWMRAGDAPVTSTTRDLSARGMRFSCNEDLTVGEVIAVELALDRVTTVTVQAQVCHVGEAVAAPGAWMIGVAFLDLPDAMQDRIIAHLIAVQSGAVPA